MSITTDKTVGPCRLLHHFTDNELITVRILIDAGSGQDPANHYGTAHYMEHMFFKGTEDKTYKEMNKIISRIGDANAYTCESRTVYYINCLAEDYEKAVDILFEMLTRPRFDPEEFNREKGVILEEVQSGLDSPQAYFGDEFGRAIFGDKKGHNTAGTKNSVQEMKLSDLIEFRKKYYNYITWIVVGKVNSTRAAAKIKNLEFPKLSVTPNNSLDGLDGLIYLKNHHLYHASKQAALAMVTKGLPATDIPGSGILSVLLNAMGGGMHSLMFDRIREELGLCYSINTVSQSYARVGAIVTVCWLDESCLPRAKNEIIKIMDDIKKAGIPEDLLELAKKNYIINMLQNTQKSSSYALEVLDPYYSQGRKITSYEKEKKQVLAVTNKDIIEFARRYFDKKCFVIMTEK
jgi:predicted Zn-dependent peptidase